MKSRLGCTLLGICTLASCSERLFVRFEPEPGLELAALAEAPGELKLSATGFVPDDGFLEIEVPVGPEPVVWVVGTPREDFDPLDEKARNLGLDPVRLRREQGIERAAGCDATYPAPTKLWRLLGDRLAESDEEVFGVHAPWLDGVCAPETAPPEGFVASRVIRSTCSRCPADQLQDRGLCRAALLQTVDTCGFAQGEVALQFDWRGHVCAPAGQACTTSNSSVLDCPVDAARCEFDFSLEGFTEQDRFATSELIVPALTDASRRTWHFGSTPSHLLRVSRIGEECERTPTATTRLELFTHEGVNSSEIELPGCSAAMVGGGEAGRFLIVTFADADKSRWRFEERSASGELQAELLIDLESLLGLGSLAEVYVAESLRWPERGEWLLFAVPIGRAFNIPVLILRREGSSLVLTLGRPFHYPEGTVSAAVMNPTEGASEIWVLSGNGLAVMDAPESELVYRPLNPVTQLGGSIPAAPRPSAIGALGMLSWSAGHSSRAPTLWRLEPPGGPVAFLSEVSGRARVLFRTAGGALALSDSLEGVHATRFDLEAWRPLPGTIRITDGEPGNENPILGVAQRDDTTIFVAHSDGRIFRVLAP